MTYIFDPYFEWLGIESGDLLPDHYCLLGLEQFESDPESISRAADAAMAKVRRIRPGANLAEWSQMLDRLSAAKACLLDPSSKQSYDQSLANGLPTELEQHCLNSSLDLGVSAPTLFEPMAMEESLADASPVDTEPDADVPPHELVASDDWAPVMVEEPISISPIDVQPVPIGVTTAKSSGLGPILAVLAILAIGLAGLFAYMMLQPEQPAAKSESVADVVAPARRPPTEDVKRPAKQMQPEKPKVVKPQAAKPKEPEPEKMEVEEVTDEKPEIEKPKPETPKPETPKPETPKPETPKPERPEPKKLEPEVDPTKAAAFAQTVKNVRASLAERDLAMASKALEQASVNAQTPEDREQIDRLQTMVENLTQFWNGIRNSMAKLEAAEELVIGGKRLSVVEGDRDYLLVRIEGRNRRFQVANLPVPLVMLLVDRYLGKDPGSRAIIGTFLAVDPKGDRTLARQYFQEAADAGFDSAKLLYELGNDAEPSTKQPKTLVTPKKNGRSN